MTNDEQFANACKAVAGLRPDLFSWDNGIDSVIFSDGKTYETLTVSRFNATQDDIDAMAAAVGSQYYVDPTSYEEMKGKWETHWLTNDQWYTVLELFPDKLTAAKAAWCAIVEQLEVKK